MDRAKEFLHEMSEDILKFMDKHRGNWTNEKVAYLVGMCDAHNNVCEFVEFAEKRGGGSDMLGDVGSMMYNDNPRRRR